MIDVRVMTYNVRYFGHATRGLTSTAGALERIAHAIAHLAPPPDIIALQEVETYSVRADLGRRRRRRRPPPPGDDNVTARKPQLLRLVDRLHDALAAAGRPERYQAHYYPGHRYSLTRRAALYTTGLALLCSRRFTPAYRESHRPVDITHRRLRATRKLKQTRICAHLRLRHRGSGAALAVFNTHLSLPAFFTSLRALNIPARMGHGRNQLAEAHALLDYIDRARGDDPCVLMGDFNTLPGSPVYRALLDAGLLADPLRAHLGLDDEGLREWPTAGFMNLRMHLDHIFSSPDLQWLDFNDSFPFGHAEGPFDGLSDHAPIIGRFRLPPPAASPPRDEVTGPDDDAIVWRDDDAPGAALDDDEAPGDVSDTPGDVSDTPGDASDTPGDVSDAPYDASDTPGDASAAPDDVSDTPSDAPVRLPPPDEQPPDAS